MAECHATRFKEKIVEKKVEGTVKKLDQLVDQLKGNIESKDTVIKAEVNEFSIQIAFEFSIF